MTPEKSTRCAILGTSRVYELLYDGTILEYIEDPPGTIIDDDGGIEIVADGDRLFKLTSWGAVSRYLGSPGQWALVGESRDVTAIASGGGHIYRLLESGRVDELGATSGNWFTIAEEGHGTLKIVADAD